MKGTTVKANECFIKAAKGANMPEVDHLDGVKLESNGYLVAGEALTNIEAELAASNERAGLLATATEELATAQTALETATETIASHEATIATGATTISGLQARVTELEGQLASAGNGSKKFFGGAGTTKKGEDAAGAHEGGSIDISGLEHNKVADASGFAPKS